MHISKISLTNYKNFSSTSVLLHPGVNTIVGENGSGKTNLLRALRLLLDENMVGRSHSLSETDFHRGLEDWRGHWISISLEFSDIGPDESMQALFQHRAADDQDESLEIATYGLLFRPNKYTRNRFASLRAGDRTALELLQQSITIDDYETVIAGKISVDLTDPDEYKRIVGDFDAVEFPSDLLGIAPDFPELGIPVPRYFSLVKEFSFSYIPALRDVVKDFQMNRNNPLRTLLNVKSDEIPEGDFDSILAKVDELNNAIETRSDVTDIRDGIRETFKETVGETYSPTSMSIKSELPTEASRLFQSLKLYVGEHGETYEGGVEELSVGGANLMFLTLKLLEFQYRTARKSIANFLVIEEPEAHIHTHIQKTLFDRVRYDSTQIIYSTHSTHISEVSEIERVNILSKEGSGWFAYQPATGLDPQQVEGAERFLDAIRSNLLFARSVLLVEGDAEEILIPSLVKTVYGVSLDEIGVSVINVRSTGFKNLANLFHCDRIRKQCAIVTDSDEAFFNVEEDPEDDQADQAKKSKARASQDSGRGRVADLDAYTAENDFVSSFYAEHTFEVDLAFADAANRELLVNLVDRVYTRPSSRTWHKAALNSGRTAKSGYTTLKMADKAGKGWFALLLSGYLTADMVVPSYIIDALGFSVSVLPTETWCRLFEYRIATWKDLSDTEFTNAKSFVDQLRRSEIGPRECARLLEFIEDDVQLRALVGAFLDE
ncbi:AAA family ATPase [Nesterenkonia sp. AY15]|uniref:ATP-dependent nuclease n=1 Tax=Nesterenkonia sp. AY15 TaxID=2901139 RepID=UPI001F4CC8D5|nr:AAA family ATPase [Nesterenkonia sp. AY15]MCH8570248.1 AAA family ATPase [Nesterenkonia sp. AY15]